MIRMFFVLILSGLPFIWAQSDFTRADMYDVGDTAQYLGLDATNAEPGDAGTGVTWDFSHLPRNNDDYEVHYENASVAPNASQFPESNLVAVQDVDATTAYTFFTVTNDSFRLDGLDLPDVGVVTYSNKYVWLGFPLSYNETQEDDFEGQYTVTSNGQTVMTHRTGTFAVKYDGYGTIILPDGSRVTNVRRLKFDQTVRDSFSVSGIDIVTEVVTTSYLFYPEGESSEVFRLTLANSSVTPPGTSVESKNASYRGTGGGGTTLASTRGAHLTTQGGDFYSEILLRNPTDSSQMMTLKAYNGDGLEVASEDVTIPAGGTTRQLQENLFPNTARSFSSSGCGSCTFSVGYRANTENASTAHVHQTERFQTEFLLYPGEWDYLFDGAAIINAGSENARVEAVQYDYEGNVLSQLTLDEALEPGGKYIGIFNSIFVNDPNSVVKLMSDQNIAVMVLRISSDGRFLYENLPLPQAPNGANQRWIAHITAENGGFDTDIWVHNSGTATGSVILQPYNTSGEPLAPVALSVEPGKTTRFTKTDMLDSATSHALITGSSECLVTVGYRSQVEGSSTAHIHEVAPIEDSFLVYPGEWDVLFDGFALVNTGSQNATITVTQLKDDGTDGNTATISASLAPNAKVLALMETLLAENPNSALRIESTQPLAVLALRLSKDLRYLYGNGVIP